MESLRIAPPDRRSEPTRNWGKGRLHKSVETANGSRCRRRELDPALEGFDRLIISIYEEAGEKAKALEVLNKLISADPENIEFAKWRNQIKGE